MTYRIDWEILTLYLEMIENATRNTRKCFELCTVICTHVRKMNYFAYVIIRTIKLRLKQMDVKLITA